jgi:hypothetical protein
MLVCSPIWRRVAVATGALGAAATAVTMLACGSDLSATGADPSGMLAVPPRAGFEIVADAMQLHCGTLDCHGQANRSMRFYGQFGMRLAPPDDPLSEPTHGPEYDATYVSVVGLEPEVMSKVASHQAPAEALAMVRKARGLEQHKGGQLQLVGDPLDVCMLGWLIGPPERDVCESVVHAPRP